MKSLRTLAVCAAAALFLGAAAHAQPFPSQTIRIVVASAPGGSTDLLGRLLAKAIQEQTGTAAIVDNRPGAGGAIGAAAVAKSAPNGYMLLLTPPDAVATLPYLKKTGLPYNVERELAPVALVAETHYTFAVPAKSPFKSMADVIAAAKVKQQGIKYASTGLGASAHLVTELLQQRTGTEFLTVHYKGAGPAVASLVSGETELATSSPATFKPFIDGGQVRALGISKATRSAIVPNVPTMVEQGFPDFVLAAWYGVFAQAQTPPDVLDKIGAILTKAVESPEVQAQITRLGLENRAMGREEFSKFFAQDARRWEQIITRSGITITD